MGLNTTDQDLLITLKLNFIQPKHKLILYPFPRAWKICEVGFSFRMSE